MFQIINCQHKNVTYFASIKIFCEWKWFYRIALYDKDPQIPSDSKVVADIEPILELDPTEHPGYYVTTIQLPYLTSESLG